VTLLNRELMSSKWNVGVRYFSQR